MTRAVALYKSMPPGLSISIMHKLPARFATLCQIAVASFCGAAPGQAAATEETTPLPTSAYTLILANKAAFRVEQRDELRLASAFRPVDLPSPTLAGKPYALEIDRAARHEGLDPALVHAVIDVESHHNAKAMSPKGAIGLMQVLPKTAARFGKNLRLTAVDDNLLAGTRYLRTLMETFHQRVDLALAAYNAGEQAVSRYGNRIPPYAETRHYVPAVIARYHEWKKPGVALTRDYNSATRLDPAWKDRIAAAGARAAQSTAPTE